MDLESLSAFEMFEEEGFTRKTLKYILISVALAAEPGRYRHIVRAGDHYNGFDHAAIFKKTQDELGPKFILTSCGGGFVQIHPKIKIIILTGQSEKLGPAPRDIIIPTLLGYPTFNGFDIKIS